MKRVKEYINEEFKEKDSDPIKDMNIGMTPERYFDKKLKGTEFTSEDFFDEIGEIIYEQNDTGDLMEMLLHLVETYMPLEDKIEFYESYFEGFCYEHELDPEELNDEEDGE
jgi:hypothetical protein